MVAVVDIAGKVSVVLIFIMNTMSAWGSIVVLVGLKAFLIHVIVKHAFTLLIHLSLSL